MMRPRAVAGRRKPPREGRQLLEQGGGPSALLFSQRGGPSSAGQEGFQRGLLVTCQDETRSSACRCPHSLALARAVLLGRAPPTAAAVLLRGHRPSRPAGPLQVCNRSGARCAPRLQQTRHPTLLTSPDTLGVPRL